MLVFLHLPVSCNEEIYLFKMTCLKITQILCKENPLWVGFHCSKAIEPLGAGSFPVFIWYTSEGRKYESALRRKMQAVCQPNIYPIPFDVTFSKFSMILLISWYVTYWKYNLMLTVNFILISRKVCYSLALFSTGWWLLQISWVTEVSKEFLYYNPQIINKCYSCASTIFLRLLSS